VSDLDWSVFRMLFDSLIQEGLNGLLTFTHDSIKEAVNALFLDGLTYMLDTVDSRLPASKQNISAKQKETHSFCILNLLTNEIDKNRFDLCTKLEQQQQQQLNSLLNQNETVKYLHLIDELIYHCYMVYDLINLCKLLTSFK
jgi:hypothetical protein